MGSICLQIFYLTLYNAQFTCFTRVHYLVDHKKQWYHCLPRLKLFVYASKNRDACEHCAWTSTDCADDKIESYGLSDSWNGRQTWELECRLKYLALVHYPFDLCFLTFN